MYFYNFPNVSSLSRPQNSSGKPRSAASPLRRASFERMNPFLDKHRIQPVIDRVYAFDEAVQAFGKVVIKIGDRGD